MSEALLTGDADDHIAIVILSGHPTLEDRIVLPGLATLEVSNECSMFFTYRSNSGDLIFDDKKKQSYQSLWCSGE